MRSTDQSSLEENVATQEAIRPVVVVRQSNATATEDFVVVEEPLEIRIAGETLALTMRTPGHDRQLAMGFLFAEGVIRSRAEVASIAHCGRTGDEGRTNVIEVTPAPGVDWVHPAERAARKGTLTTSACGVCGRRTIDDLFARCARVDRRHAVHGESVSVAIASLSTRQPIFRRTGGCHAAALCDAAGSLLVGFEDVGRHNAVDKVVGAWLLQSDSPPPLADHILVVSGRTSFEIVQKAAAAGIGVVAGVSAPSSLAIDLARRMGITLLGFVRGTQWVCYAGDVNSDPLTPPATDSHSTSMRTTE
jgi:FdhD protein